MKIDNLAARIETIAPLTMQEPWDHSGWQLRLTDRTGNQRTGHR